MLWRCMLYTFQGAVDSLGKIGSGSLGARHLHSWGPTSSPLILILMVIQHALLRCWNLHLTRKYLRFSNCWDVSWLIMEMKAVEVGLPVMVFVLERCEGLREGSNIVVLRDPDGFLFEANLLAKRHVSKFQWKEPTKRSKRRKLWDPLWVPVGDWNY